MVAIIEKGETIVTVALLVVITFIYVFNFLVTQNIEKYITDNKK